MLADACGTRPLPILAPTMSDPTKPGADPKCPVRPLWRRLGVVAFVFFLLKGLLWLAVPALVATGWMSSR